MVPQLFSQLHHIYKCTDGFNSTTPFSQTHLCLKSMESELAFVSVRTDALSQIPENFEDILSLRKAFSSTESWAWICPCKKEEDVVAYLAQKLLLLVTSEIVLETTIQDCMKVCHWWLVTLEWELKKPGTAFQTSGWRDSATLWWGESEVLMKEAPGILEDKEQKQDSDGTSSVVEVKKDLDIDNQIMQRQHR